jgi:hypothetical protein
LPGLRRFVLPAAGLLGVALLAGFLGFISEGGPAQTLEASPVASRPAAVRGTVQSVAGDNVTIATSGGPVSLRLVPATTYEAIRPAQLSRVAPGDWLNAGAVPHEQTLFAVTGLLVIPQALLEAKP